MKLTLLITLSLAFPLTHMVMSHGAIRAKLLGLLGKWPFRGVYSLVSILTLGAAIEVFRHNLHLGPVLWDLPRWLELVIALPLVFVGLQLIFLLLATPSPAGMIPARPEARGVLRITRHPMNMGIALIAFAHMVTNGTVGDLAFFGSFFLLGLFGTMHQDRRLARERGTAFREFQKQTSGLPFVAILTGKQKLEVGELSFPLLLLGAAAFAALVFFHGRLFGIGLF